MNLDMAELKCLPPTCEPRVTEHIEQIKELITKIMKNGHAYAIEGDVYFSVDSFPEYLLLSGRKLDQNRAGERVAVDVRKRNPAYFALRKVLKQLKEKALKRAHLTEEQLQEQIEQRTAARKNKQFDVSDGIRRHLATLGISLMDGPTGTVWRPCEPKWPEQSGSVAIDVPEKTKENSAPAPAPA